MSTAPIEPPAFPTPLLEAIFWRGVFLHRYSGMEHTVTELLLRAGGRPEYAGFGDLPYPWKRRINRLRAILDATGPLSGYADDLRRSLKPITGVERHRHILAHGMMSYNPNGDRPGEIFIKTHDWIDGTLGEVYLWISLEDMRRLADEIAPFVQQFTRTVARIFREAELLPIQTDSAVPLAVYEREV